MAKRQFLKDVVGVFNSNVFSLVCGLLLSVLLTRELGPAGFGLFTSLIVIPLIVVSITNLGIRGAAIYLIGQKKIPEQDIVSAILSLFLISSFAGIIMSFLAYRVYDDPGFTLLLIGLVLAVIPFRLALVYIGGIFIGKDEIRKANQLNWPINLINLTLAAILVWGLKLDVIGAVISALVANIAIAIYGFVILSKHYRLSFRFDFNIIKKLFLLGILYSASFFIIMLNFRLDIILLERMRDLHEVGLYSLGVNIAEQLWQIPLAISIILFSRTANTGDPHAMTAKTLSLARASMILAVCLSVIIFFTAPPLIPLVFGQKFIPSVLLLQVILPGVVLMIIFRILSGQLAGMGKPQLSIYIFAPALALNIGLNYLLIPPHGALGAAIATNISYAVGAVGYWIIFARHTGCGYLEIIRFRKGDVLSMTGIISKLFNKWKN
ncbi:MAG: flippase [Bacteroidales bacterium]|nr:flippase [Bacteroidales bacterium]